MEKQMVTTVCGFGCRVSGEGFEAWGSLRFGVQGRGWAE